MKVTLSTLFLLISFFVNQLNAQAPSSTVTDSKPIICGFDHAHDQLLENNEELKQQEEAMEEAILKRRLSKNPKNLKLAGEVLTVPVVIHIIHANGTPIGTAENISEAQVLAGIQHLNDALRKRGSFVSGGADIEIEFCLAKRDPMGNATTGINRVASPLTNVNSDTQDLLLKNLIRWDPTKYVNIWLVKEIVSAQGSGVAGYAYLASSHGSNVDGIVNEARYFGSSVNNSKVHIHEVGHYFNLYHTFQGGCQNGNCLLDGDRVCDTPPDQSTAAVACNMPPNTCSTDGDDASVQNPFGINGTSPGDQPDMIENYMDYGFQSCQTTFTEGQKVRMITALETFRASLLSSNACQDPCPTPFTYTINPPLNIYAGVSGQYSIANASSSGVTYTWDFGDGSAQVTGSTVSHTYASTGSYTIMVSGDNGTSVCLNNQSVSITVGCEEDASFTTPVTSLNAGSTVTFINTSSSVGSPNVMYDWFVNDVLVATTTDLTYTFNTSGRIEVKLAASGPNCSDTARTTVVVSNVRLGIVGTAKTICVGDSVVLYALGTSSSRVWTYDNSTGSFIVVKPTTTTTYTLTSGSDTAIYTVEVCEDENCSSDTTSTFNPFLLSTGNNGLTQRLPNGALDPNWSVSRGNINGPYSPAFSYNAAPPIPGNYSRSPWPNATWIGPQNLSGASNTTFFYRLRFNLTASEAQNLSFQMQFLADNQVIGMTVNGNLYPNTVITNPNGNFVGFQTQNARVFTLSGPWVVGQNEVILHVFDGGGLSGFLGQLLPSSDIPLPEINIIDPGCIATTTTLTANIPNGVWSASCGSCITSGGVFDPAISGLGNHTVYYSQNCQIDTLEISVCPPECEVEIEVDKPVACAGDTITFTAVPSNTGSTLTYEWINTGTGNFLSNNQSVTVTAGSSNISVLLIARSASGDCSDTAYYTVIINTIDGIDVIQDTLCNEAGCAEATLIPLGGSSPYIFTIGGVDLSTTDMLDYEFCDLGVPTLIDLQDRNGCKTTTTFTPDCEPIAPPCEISLMDTITICQDSSVQLNAKASCDTSVVINTCLAVTPPTTTCDGATCNRTISGGSGVNINSGETVCVAANTTLTGGINMNGGKLIICGDAKPSYFNVNNGEVIINGTFEANSLNINSSSASLKNYGTMNLGGFAFQGMVENHGTLTVQYDLSVNSNGNLLNTGTIIAKSSLLNNNIFVNEGTVEITNDLKDNGASRTENYCTIAVAKNYFVDKEFYNYGSITVGETTYLNSYTLFMGDDAQVSTKNIFVNNTVAATGTSCALITVANNTTINGSGNFSGPLSFCDLNGVETNNKPSQTASFLNCSCTPAPVGGSGSSATISYLWSPTTGLSSSTVYDPIASPSTSTWYTVSAFDTEGNVVASKDVYLLVEDCVEEDTTTINTSMFLAPNPFTGGATLTINSTLPNVYWSEVTVMDMLGNEVYRNNYFPINAGVTFGWEFQPGTYVLKVVLGNEMYTEIIIKL